MIMKTPREKIDDIIREAIAGFPHTNFEQVMGPCRHRHIVRARWAAMAAVKSACPHLSTLRLGRIFGRDHTTILYGLSDAWRERKAETRLRRISAVIQAEVRAS